jgi:hypothetical protein
MRSNLLLLCAVVICGAVVLPVQGSAQTNSAPDIPDSPSFYLGTNSLPGPGLYAIPFTPLIMTPIAKSPQPALQVGASNSTGENVAGARDSTASLLQSEPPAVTPKVVDGASVSYDLYPKADDSGTK